MRIVFLCAVLAAHLAHSAESPRWVGPTVIKRIHVQPNGNIYIHLDANTPNLGCPGNDEGYLQLDTDAPNFNAQYSLLLMAYSTQKALQIYASGCAWYPIAQNTYTVLPN